MKAKPTTYNGIRFRSKTEAIYAVALDQLANIDECPLMGWDYEPRRYGEWLPDFEIYVANHLVCYADHCVRALIEVKPCEPSSDYIKWLGAQARCATASDCDCVMLLHSERSSRGIRLGYNVPGNSYFDRFWWKVAILILNQLGEASQHRFDLDIPPIRDRRPPELPVMPIPPIPD